MLTAGYPGIAKISRINSPFEPRNRRGKRVHLIDDVYSITGSAIAVCVLSCGCALAQSAADDAAASAPPVLPAPSSSVFNEERIAGVIPDYQTVRDSRRSVPPLTVRQKFDLAFKETIDPFNIASAAFTAGWAMIDNQTPRYGEGAAAYAKRLGAAQGDFASQNFFSAGVFASLLHQDPRYFRLGPERAGLIRRIAYSISRLGIARQDSGKSAFNGSNIFGMILGIAASNAYYPSASRTGTVMVGRVGTSLMGGAIGNLMSEFWPDVQKRLHKKK
jgi:hypothetical protein